jgi:hypothetical protein
MITLIYNEKTYINHSETELLALSVPQAHINAAKTDVMLDIVRKQRAPLLDQADIAINKAIDKGEDATPLRVYRQALRDITTTFANDLANVAWPVKPL